MSPLSDVSELATSLFVLCPVSSRGVVVNYLGSAKWETGAALSLNSQPRWELQGMAWVVAGSHLGADVALRLSRRPVQGFLKVEKGEGACPRAQVQALARWARLWRSPPKAASAL